MRVRLKAWISNEDYSGRPGQVLDLPEPEASRLVAIGRAEPAEASLETAAVVPPRNAMRPVGRPREKK